MKYKIGLLVILFGAAGQFVVAQGPPITGDKPIMLGGNTFEVRTLTEVRNTNEGTFVKAPLMGDYIITSDISVSAVVPFVSYDFMDSRGSGNTLGDINLIGKYQFYRKDEMGKTFRMVAKTMQTLPTGDKLGLKGMSTGMYSGYYGVIAGYESLKLGISNEVGYQWVPDGVFDKFQYKLGFGVPLLKPTYPVNQLNLFFEYSSESYTTLNEYQLLYAQGIQYAKGKVTVDAAVQFPLIQDIANSAEKDFNYSVFLGMRYIL
ncbi:hypothetical protein ATE92_0620 [Ulvibacter sp. MAR_2010_11]|uniref:hypothetical protein n=1 Tax=Ulvibacter sp. MAR_2010_11 TaxID=1250229 RepID=UPI000C2CD622|nr:hypothetical protein [Ulvibacter sp. MAR_2010_11]PKA82490.1 hypothetical protein ATE92_0620 [Ulvibacter sp. MAR_2010_11]